MAVVVGREGEKARIVASLETIAHPTRMLKEPLVVFESPIGGGADELLEYDESVCSRLGITCIRGAQQFLPQDTDGMKNMLSKGPLALTIKLGGLGDQQLEAIAASLEILHKCEHSANLFTAMAWPRRRQFGNGYIDTRLLTHIPLKPLEHGESSQFLRDNMGIADERICATIEDWTGGYPLGLTALATIVHQTKLNPNVIDDQFPLLVVLSQKVVRETLLVHITNDLTNDHVHLILGLFSIPKRPFDGRLADALFKEFLSSHPLNPPQALSEADELMKQVPGIFQANPGALECRVHPMLRPLFNTEGRIASPKDYKAIHAFLVKWYRDAGQNGPADYQTICDEEVGYHEAWLRYLQ